MKKNTSVLLSLLSCLSLLFLIAGLSATLMLSTSQEVKLANIQSFHAVAFLNTELFIILCFMFVPFGISIAWFISSYKRKE